MSRRHRAGAFALAWACVHVSVSLAATLTYDEGIARDASHQRVLYREQHWLRRDGERPIERLVLYRCADGTAFARKQVDYRDSLVAPAFDLFDARSGYREGMRRAPAPVAFTRAGEGQAERAAVLSSARLVADAGFDEFIHRQWPLLLAGDAVPLEFVVPSRQQSLGFTVRRVGAATVDGETAWIFRLRLGGWLGWVAPHIDVAYGQRSRRLLRFEGLSNLRQDDGDGQLTVRIDFPAAPRPAGEAGWQQAEAMPLTACKTGQ